jgi:hypothetical protein
MPLESILIKNLAQDIEASGLTRKEFNLGTYLDTQQLTYGKRGDKRRRDVQKKFDQLLRKSPEAYLKFLDKYNVNSGEALKREIRSSNSIQSKPTIKTNSTSAGSGSDSDSDSDSGSGSDSEDSEESESSDDETPAIRAKLPSKP